MSLQWISSVTDDTPQRNAAAIQNEHKLIQIWFFLLGELWLSSLPYSQTCC